MNARKGQQLIVPAPKAEKQAPVPKPIQMQRPTTKEGE